MPTVKLTSGFSLITEGSHIFKVVGSEYKEKFGKIELKLVTKNGQKHTERFNVNSDGGCNAFSYFAKTALNDYYRKEIDPSELVGHYIRCEVVHASQPHRDDPNKTITFVNLKDKSVATSFDDNGGGEPVAEAPKAEEKPAGTAKYDLSFLDN